MEYVSEFPTRVDEVMAGNSELRRRHFREEHNCVLDKMLVVSDGLVDAIVHESEGLPEGEENVFFEMDREESSDETASFAESSVEAAKLSETSATMQHRPRWRER